MTDKKVEEISDRYIELYEQITGERFKKEQSLYNLDSMEKAIITTLENI